MLAPSPAHIHSLSALLTPTRVVCRVRGRVSQLWLPLRKPAWCNRRGAGRQGGVQPPSRVHIMGILSDLTMNTAITAFDVAEVLHREVQALFAQAGINASLVLMPLGLGRAQRVG